MWLVARNKPSFTPRLPSWKVFLHLLMAFPFWASEMGGPGVCGGVVRSAGTAKDPSLHEKLHLLMGFLFWAREMGGLRRVASCREGRWSLLRGAKLTITCRWEHEGRVPKVHPGGAAGASARQGMQRHGGGGGMQGWRRQHARRACLNGRGHRICAPIQHPKKKVRRGLSPYELKPTFQKKKAKRGLSRC